MAQLYVVFDGMTLYRATVHKQKETDFPEYALLFAWSFINEVKKRRSDYLKEGGKFIVPLPDVKVVSE